MNHTGVVATGCALHALTKSEFGADMDIHCSIFPLWPAPLLLGSRLTNGDTSGSREPLKFAAEVRRCRHL